MNIYIHIYIYIFTCVYIYTYIYRQIYLMYIMYTYNLTVRVPSVLRISSRGLPIVVMPLQSLNYWGLPTSGAL